MLKVASLTATASSSGTITFTTPILFDFEAGAAAVRYYRFWPALKRPQNNLGSNMITNERGFLFSLDVTLVPDYEEYFDLITPIMGDPAADSEVNQAYADDSADSPLAQGGLIDSGATTNLADGTNLITEPEIGPKIAGRI